jgi:hypothetical protein
MPKDPFDKGKISSEKKKFSAQISGEYLEGYEKIKETIKMVSKKEKVSDSEILETLIDCTLFHSKFKSHNSSKRSSENED